MSGASSDATRLILSKEVFFEYRARLERENSKYYPFKVVEFFAHKKIFSETPKKPQENVLKGNAEITRYVHLLFSEDFRSNYKPASYRYSADSKEPLSYRNWRYAFKHEDHKKEAQDEFIGLLRMLWNVEYKSLHRTVKGLPDSGDNDFPCMILQLRILVNEVRGTTAVVPNMVHPVDYVDPHGARTIGQLIKDLKLEDMIPIDDRGTRMYIGRCVCKRIPWFIDEVQRRPRQYTGRVQNNTATGGREMVQAILWRRGPEQDHAIEVITWVATTKLAKRDHLTPDLMRRLIESKMKDSTATCTNDAQIGPLENRKRQFNETFDIISERLSIIDDYRAWSLDCEPLEDLEMFEESDDNEFL